MREEAFRESEEKYRKLFEEAMDAIFVADAETGILIDCNRAALGLVGRKKSELVDKHQQILYPPEEIEGELSRTFKQHLKEKEGQVLETSVITKKGEIKDVAIKASIFELKGKKVLLGIFRDITDRKKSEEALRKREREYQMILDSVPVSIYHMDSESKFVHVNEALAKRYGMTPADFKGKTSKELFPEIGEEYIKSDREVLESGEPQTGVTGKIKTPGGVRWVRLDKVPIKDADGNVTGIIGFELDITEHIQVQEELRNAHKELLDILEFLPDATFVIDRDKKVIAWNRAIEEMTGIRKEDIIGKGDYAYAVPLYGVRRPIVIDLIFLSDKEIESRYKYVKREGNALFAETFISSLYGGKGAYLWITATPIIDSKGNIVGAIESIRDITERKKAERQSQLLKELETVNNELKDFAHIVSHDLKAPLRAITALAEWLSLDYRDTLDAAGIEKLDLLINRAERMQNLIDGILQYSRVGRLKEDEKAVDLNTLVSEVISMINPPKNIGVGVVNELPTIICEKTRMEQVFQNLLSNAVKYMDKPKGKITVGCTDENGYWKFSVADNGPGIEEKYYAKIFQIFQTPKVRDDVESTGIGLAIVKKNVERNGGKIWVESKVGEGSTFFFTVPKKKRVKKEAGVNHEK